MVSLFFFHSISSEYQLENLIKPTLFAFSGLQPFCFVGLLLRFYASPLDRFSSSASSSPYSRNIRVSLSSPSPYILETER
jgi:hypothetical protein